MLGIKKCSLCLDKYSSIFHKWKFAVYYWFIVSYAIECIKYTIKVIKCKFCCKRAISPEQCIWWCRFECQVNRQWISGNKINYSDKKSFCLLKMYLTMWCWCVYLNLPLSYQLDKASISSAVLIYKCSLWSLVSAFQTIFPKSQQFQWGVNRNLLSSGRHKFNLQLICSQ